MGDQFIHHGERSANPRNRTIQQRDFLGVRVPQSFDRVHGDEHVAPELGEVSAG
jgi:hypothetical protein